MKITVYTITDCEFSKKEKEYLAAHNLPYEEKNLEQNREWLTEMLAVSNNFAGTPVTKIEKDDGKIEVLKGFTPEEFDEVLGFSKPAADQPTPAQATVPPPTPSPTTSPTPTTQPPTTSPSSAPTVPPPPPPNTNQSPITNNQQPSTNNQEATTNNNDPLNSILADLEAKATDQPTTPPAETNISSMAVGQPSTTNSPNPLPSIPDFPDKTT